MEPKCAKCAKLEVLFDRTFRAALANALKSHSRALPGQIGANGKLGSSKTAELDQNSPETAPNGRKGAFFGPHNFSHKSPFPHIKRKEWMCT